MGNTYKYALISIPAFGLVAFVDYLTGSGLSLSLFYLLPIGLLILTVNFTSALVGACLAAGLCLLTDYLDSAHGPNSYKIYWAATSRFAFFTIFILLAKKLRESYAKLDYLAMTDALTNLRNSRGFYEIGVYEFVRHKRARKPLALAYIDVDNFKEVNDTLGHAEGDHVLKSIAQLLASGRSTDIPGRMGGDEFVILLPETNAAGAKKIMQEMLSKLNDLALQHQWPISFSVGLVTVSKVEGALDVLVNAADKAMYEIKNSTKNGIRVIDFSFPKK
jgi:diguanylate cyclase (GGDEF)-like protein